MYNAISQTHGYICKCYSVITEPLLGYSLLTVFWCWKKMNKYGFSFFNFIFGGLFWIMEQWNTQFGVKPRSLFKIYSDAISAQTPYINCQSQWQGKGDLGLFCSLQSLNLPGPPFKPKYCRIKCEAICPTVRNLLIQQNTTTEWLKKISTKSTLDLNIVVHKQMLNELK